MTLFTSFLTAAAVAFALPAFADDGVQINDAYARASGATAKSGAIFMTITNHATTEDRLIGAASDAAKQVQLHTHITDANGVMQMREVADGIALAAGDAHALARGGDHIMLLGLTRVLAQGDVITLTLTFAQAGDVVVQVPVDNERQDAMGTMTGHQQGHAGGDHTKGTHTDGASN